MPVRVIPRPPKIWTASRAVSCAVWVAYILSRAIGPASCLACSLYDCTILSTRTRHSGKWAYHVVHLVRNVLQPALHRLNAGNHGSNFAADDGLRCQGLPKRLALTYPFETLLHDRTLSTSRGRYHHPAFVIKIAANRGPSSNIAHVRTAGEMYLSITKIPPPSGPRVFSTGTLTLSNVTYAVPAAVE
jgi:hypothetical protein